VATCNDQNLCNSSGAYNPEHKNEVLYRDSKWNMGWSSWNGLQLNIGANNTASACMVFRNWADHERDVAVTYFLKRRTK
jgi:hypothetical protein